MSSEYNNKHESPAETNHVTYETEKHSLRQRILHAIGVIIFGGAIIAGVVAFILEKLQINNTASAVIVLLSYVPVFWLAWLTFKNKESVTVIPPPPSPEQEQAAAEVRRKEEEFYDKWWVRYLMAGVMFAGAVYFSSIKPDKWLVPAIFVIVGIIMMRELLFIGIAIGAIWLLFSGLASLPVSAAIIIGAIIIASALRK